MILCLVPRTGLPSPAALGRALSGFTASGEARGLSFCVLFAPLAAGAGPDSVGGNAPERGFLARGADEPLVPASLAKLATTTRALETLGSGFTFTTRVLAGGPVENGVLRGDLVLRGGGDPFLVSERLWLLVHQLRLNGLRRITGRVLVDPSLLSTGEDDPARRERETGEKAYAARLSALPVNWNAAAFRVLPGETKGDAALVTPDPLPCGYLRIESRVRTAAAGTTDSVAVSLAPDSLGERAVLGGHVALGGAGLTLYRSVSDPDRFAGSLARAFLEDSGIAVEGGSGVLGRDASPKEARPLLEYASLPLGTLLQSMNRFSNNLMADQIAMALADTALGVSSGASRVSGPAVLNLTRGAARTTRWLRERFSAGDRTILRDGSGLNPVDRVTGRALLSLLVKAWRDLRIQPDLVCSLPRPGEDGTLRKRFADGPGLRLRAKTGTMGSPPVSGIAGYLEHPELGPTAFVILMNGSGDWSIPKMQGLQEDWILLYAAP